MDMKKVVAKASDILDEINEHDVPDAVLERFKDVRLNLAILWLVLDKASNVESGVR